MKEKNKENKPGLILNILTCLVVLLNIVFVFIYGEKRFGLDFLVGEIILSVFIFPIIIVGLFTISKKFRNLKSLVKVFFCTSLVIFISTHIPKTAEKIQEMQTITYNFVRIKYVDNTKMIVIRKVTAPLCDEYVRQTKEDLKTMDADYDVEETNCITQLPENYEGIFEDKKIKYPYISINKTPPTRYVYETQDQEKFKKICELFESQDKLNKCIF